MPKAQHLFAVTRWLLNAGMLFSLFLVAVLALAFGACVLAATGLVHLPIPAEDLKELGDIPLALSSWPAPSPAPAAYSWWVCWRWCC